MFTRPLAVYNKADQHDARGMLFYPQTYISLITKNEETAWTIFRKREMDNTAHVRVGEYMSQDNPIQYHVRLSVFRDYSLYVDVCKNSGVQALDPVAWKEHLDLVEKFYPGFQAVA